MRVGAAVPITISLSADAIAGLPVLSTPIATEPAKADVQTEETIYKPQDEEIDFEIPYSEPKDVSPQPEYKGISDDSPYNIKENIQYESGLESSYLDDMENIYQKPN